MALETGTHLGQFEVLASLGTGGMGEVYRARDSRLHRDVAIKVLRQELAHDPVRLARLAREARALAAINHPNIATLFGFEQETDASFLVMELVEGETLADRIARGPIPVEETVPLFLQIAEGLEAAHEKGVIHRDLKPANMMVSETERVKILDFGLAKAMVAEASGEDDSTRSRSPTLALAATRQGAILGTTAYMSPEQASGKRADKRTDIWAFGACMYEALTGRRAFEARDAPNTLAAVLRDEVDLSALGPDVPGTVRRLIHHCLVREPRDRLRDIGDVRIELGELLSISGEPQAPVVPAATSGAKHLGVVVGVVVGAALAAWAMSFLLPDSGNPGVVSRTSVLLPEGQSILRRERAPVAISPDGSQLVYVASLGDRSQLYRRPIDSFEATPIHATEGAASPFFSPDGSWLGFFAGRELRKVPIGGGDPQRIADAPYSWGASWGDDDQIVFSGTLGSGLLRVSASGGRVEKLTTPNFSDAGYAHVWPDHLPGGRTILFTIWGKSSSSGPEGATGVSEGGAGLAATLSLDTGEWELIKADASGAVLLANRYLIYQSSSIPGTLVASATDQTLDDLGPPVPVLADGHFPPFANRFAGAVSKTGTLVYVPAATRLSALVQIDREGMESAIEVGGELDLAQARLSPRGGRVVAADGDGRRIWVIDIERGSRVPIAGSTPEEGMNQTPIWTPDGTRITFASNRGGNWELFSRMADGTGSASRLLERTFDQLPSAWSRDGRLLAINELHPATALDIWLMTADGQATEFLATSANEKSGAFSPDGRWLAYVSDESGRDEVYVQSTSSGGGKTAISVDGGNEPVWSPRGDELFFRDGNQLLVVSVRSTDTDFNAERPGLLLERPYELNYPWSGAAYDVYPGGDHFLVLSDNSAHAILVVQNWFDELKHLFPDS